MGDSDSAPATKKDIQKMMALLTKMDGNLSKNTEEIGKIHQRLDALDSSYVKLCDRVDKVEKSVKDIDPVVIDTQNKVTLSAENQAQLLKRIQILEATVEKQKIEVDALRKGQCDLTARSMRDNVVIYNISEDSEYETDDQTYAKVADFMMAEMKMPLGQPQRFDIDRCHRMPTGKNRNPSNPRPVVLHFVTSTQKHEFMSYKSNLDKNKFQISDQYPAELSDKRLTLKHASNNDPAIKDIPKESKKLRNDKLFVRGKEYTPRELDEANAPQHYDMDTVNWNEDVPKIVSTDPLKDKEKGNVFVAYAARVHSRQQVKVVQDEILSRQGRDVADNLMFAYRIDNGEEPDTVYYDNDREHGAGRRILKLITDTPAASNTMVIVARWFKGHIGLERWKAIEGLTEKALKSLLFEHQPMEG